jgi:hypothetical protein
MDSIAFVVSVRHGDGGFSKYVVCAPHALDAEELVMARQSQGVYVAWARPMGDSDLYEIKGE